MTEDGAPLARQLLQLRQDLSALRARVDQLPGPDALQEMVGQLSALADRVNAIEAAANERPAKVRVWDWSALLTEGGPDAQRAGETLTAWVNAVLGTMYGLVAWEAPDVRIQRAKSEGRTVRLIPPCWNQHHDLIAELGWLCQEWLEIYRTAKGTPARAGDWHDRYLMGLRRRIGWSSAATCTESHLGQTAAAATEPPRYDYEPPPRY
ncbi:hypothetical protein AB0D67_37790 [Streptosporangium sp. NPDC048047]|uniref:hypothetical protein n=1 Tax=Streptosporangium sp. NPDC048047 TaxID=3155748 RepID=UPI003446DA29